MKLLNSLKILPTLKNLKLFIYPVFTLPVIVNLSIIDIIDPIEIIKSAIFIPSLKNFLPNPISLIIDSHINKTEKKIFAFSMKLIKSVDYPVHTQAKNIVFTPIKVKIKYSNNLDLLNL